MYGIGKKTKFMRFAWLAVGRVCKPHVLKNEKSTPTSVLTRDTNQRRLVT
jgi:hypothetical protein